MPERQLAGGMQMESSAQRPGLDQQTPFPERLPDVALGDAIDTCGELELRRGLNLRVHTADVVSNADEAGGGHTVSQKAAGQSACTDLDPSRGNHRSGSWPISETAFRTPRAPSPRSQ